MLLLTLLLAVTGLVEFYRALGAGSPAVYAALWAGAADWFARGAVLHVGTGCLLLGAALATGRRSDIATWMGAPLRQASARRWRRILAATLVLMLVYLVGVEIREIGRVLSRPTDFGAFYRAAQAVATGHDPYAATDAAYFYPPTFAHALRPLTRLPVGGASLLWFVLKLGLLIASARMCFDLLDGRRLDERGRIGFLLGLLAVSSRFWVADLRYGNSNILVLALVVGTLYFDHRKRSFAAAFCLAAATTIKVVPALLAIHLLARGRWRELAWAAAMLVALNLLPAVSGAGALVEQWRAYLGAGVVGKLTSSLSQPDNQSLWGFLGRLSVDGGAPHRAVWALLSGALLIVAASVSRRTRHDDDASVLAASLYPGVLLVVSPGSWVVHYVGTMLPVSAVLRLVVARATPRGIYLGAFAIACGVFAMSGWSRWSVRHSIQQSWFLGALLLVLASLVVASRRSLPRPPATSIVASSRAPSV